MRRAASERGRGPNPDGPRSENDGSVDGFAYAGRAPPSRPAPDYTVRVVPSKSGVLVPREVNSIVWQKT
jgi:hypothetical protein